MPLYARAGSAVPAQGGLLIYGEGEWAICTDEGPVRVELRGGSVRSGCKWRNFYLLGEALDEVEVDGVRARGVAARIGTYVEQGDCGISTT